MSDLYHYDGQTGEFKGTSQARMDPVDATPMVPRNATLLAPPDVGANEVAVFSDGAWSAQIDLRGTEYWASDGTPHVISEVGIIVPSDALDGPPPAARDDQVAQALADLYAQQAALLRTHTNVKSLEETITWMAKKPAAERIAAGSSSDDDRRIFNRSATERGMTVSDFAAYILGRDRVFSELVDLFDAEVTFTEKQIAAAEDPSIPLADVEALLASALTQFETRANDGAQLILAEAAS